MGVLAEVDITSSLIELILRQQLRPHPIHLSNIIIVILLDGY
jgi:hypothetical protein